MKRITILLIASWSLAVSGCGTLTSIADDAGKVDWIAVLQSAHTVYDSIIGPITRDCSVLGDGDEVLNSVCTKIGEFDIAASQTLAFGDMAVAVGEDVSGQVTEAKKKVEALKAAYAAFLGVKARSASAATTRTREVPAARSTNPYRAKAELAVKP